MREIEAKNRINLFNALRILRTHINGDYQFICAK